MTEILAHGYSSESTQQELSNEYQLVRVYMVFEHLCALDESSLGIGRVNTHNYNTRAYGKETTLGAWEGL